LGTAEKGGKGEMQMQAEGRNGKGTQRKVRGTIGRRASVLIQWGEARPVVLKGSSGKSRKNAQKVGKHTAGHVTFSELERKGSTGGG